ncbi:hypothetical protein I6F34_40800, partial [Bradyrhizobium sp. BRP05]|nr:hypothetical protein [Bradyrhizobium sp. BRP05]
EDALLYSTGHIPGAQRVDWHTELNDPVTRDFVGPEAFAEFAASKGISRDTTVVFYGDKSNWWAAYALWVFTLYGHEDLRLMDGGRDKWIAEGRETTREVPTVARAEYPVIEPWKEKDEWQEPGPILKVAGNTAYVTDAEAQKLVAVDL